MFFLRNEVMIVNKKYRGDSLPIMLASLTTSISSAPLTSLGQTVGRRHVRVMDLADRVAVL